MSAAGAVAAWAGAAVTAALVVIGAAVAAVYGDVGATLWYAPMSLAFGVVGSVVLAARPRHLLGALFAATGVVVALLTLMEQLATTGLALDWPTQIVRLLSWLAVWPIELTVGLIIAAFLVFPDGRLPSPRWRPVLVATAVTTTVGAAMAALTSVNFDASVWRVPPLVSLLGPGPAAAVFAVYRIVALGLLVLAALSLVTRCRGAGMETRRAVMWVAGAGFATVAAVLLSFPVGVDPSTATRVLLPCIPVAAGVAVLQGRLYEPQSPAPRTLVYGMISALLIAGLLVLALGGGRLAGGTVVGLAVTAAVLLAGDPVRRRLQRRLDVLLLGDPDLPSLAQRLSAPVPGEPAELLRELAEQLAAQLGRTYVGIEHEAADGSRSCTDTGAAPVDIERVALVHAGEPLGTLLLARSPLRSLRHGQRQAVRQVLPYVALVTAAARVSAERDLARRQLIAVREEERARIRRLLHDAAGGLSGVALQLDVVGDDVSPERAEQLRGMRREITDVARVVRGLAYEMGPPALAEGTLVEALARTLGALPPRGGRSWRVEVRGGDDVSTLPAAVSVAAYRVAVEAGHNAYRHSAGRTCLIDILLEDELRVVVTDDGRGLPEGWCPGVGVTAMRERAEELGGSLQLQPAAGGGTVVELRVPVQRESS